MSIVAGDWVLYALSANDVRMIRERRLHLSPQDFNPVLEDQICPALVVAVWGTKANLKVFLDGSDAYWIPQREESREAMTGYFYKPTLWKPFYG